MTSYIIFGAIGGTILAQWAFEQRKHKGTRKRVIFAVCLAGFALITAISYGVSVMDAGAYFA